MNKESLSEAIGMIDEQLVANAMPVENNNSHKTVNKAIAAVIIIAIAVSGTFGIQKLLKHKPTYDEHIDQGIMSSVSDASSMTDTNLKDSESLTHDTAPEVSNIKYVLVDAEYPSAEKGLWIFNQTKEESLGYSAEDAKKDSLELSKLLISYYLSDDMQNTVFSPFSVYMSLASLAEITGGETRTQILSLLNVSSVEELRTNVRAMILSVYCNGYYYGIQDEELQSCIPANSFWLNANADVSGDPDTANILKNNYYTSFYKGDPADDNFQDAYRSWLNRHTGGLMSEKINNLSFSPDTVFSMISTLYLDSGWIIPFIESQNTRDVFYGTKGECEAEYMNDPFYFLGSYFKGDGFSATYLNTKSNCKVWFLLPDENESLDSMIKNRKYMDLLDALQSNQTERFACPEGYDLYQINLTVPKFDITFDCDLKNALYSFGITDVFDAEKADISFVRSNDGENIYLTDATQSVRMLINEKGISAAAVTIGDGGLGDPIFYNVDFCLNRPFMVLVLSDCNTPLFAAAVNNIE